MLARYIAFDLGQYRKNKIQEHVKHSFYGVTLTNSHVVPNTCSASWPRETERPFEYVQENNGEIHCQ